MGMIKKKDFDPISDDEAIEKGIELSYELLLYLIIVAFSVYEIRAGSLESKQKKKHL